VLLLRSPRYLTKLGCAGIAGNDRLADAPGAQGSRRIHNPKRTTPICHKRAGFGRAFLFLVSDATDIEIRRG
jgi:hypothetical protein